MKTLPANGTQLYDVAVFNAQVPAEGPKASPVSIPFTAVDTSFKLSMLLTQASQTMSMVQGLFIDNSLNQDALTIQTDVLHQNLIFPPASQGYVPLLSPKNADITFTSSGEVTVSVILLNVPVPAAVWSVDAPPAEYVVCDTSATTTLGDFGGARGDYLDHIVIIPLTTSPGNVVLDDGLTAIDIFAGGASSVSNLVPFTIPLGAVNKNGAWTVTCGANVAALAVGRFT